MKIKFYKCNVCGKVIAVVKDSIGTTMCCNQPMVEIKMKSKEQDLLEKHVPTYIRKDNKIVVNVGSTLHPAMKEHHIEWISLLTNKGYQVRFLEPTRLPVVTFNVDPDEEVKEISSYCNIHSLYTFCPDNADDEEDDCGCEINY